MQNVDFEMKYEHEKGEADPLDFLSRHPLPMMGNNDTENVLKATILEEHAVLLARMKEETARWNLAEIEPDTIRKGDCESCKRDVDLAHKALYSVWRGLSYQQAYSAKLLRRLTSWDTWGQ